MQYALGGYMLCVLTGREGDAAFCVRWNILLRIALMLRMGRVSNVKHSTPHIRESAEFNYGSTRYNRPSDQGICFQDSCYYQSQNVASRPGCVNDEAIVLMYVSV